MRVMVFAMATQDSQKGEPPTAEAFAAIDRFTEELAAPREGDRGKLGVA